MPVMSDFYEILMNQPEEAKGMTLFLELFVNGSLNIFNHQTNVDVDNRFMVYGIRDLGTELGPITMLVMMESIQNRIIETGKRGVSTWLYIDEFMYFGIFCEVFAVALEKSREARRIMHRYYAKRS